jgi:hypothetical protein
MVLDSLPVNRPPMREENVIRGRCLCGIVQFAVTAPFEYSAY